MNLSKSIADGKRAAPSFASRVESLLHDIKVLKERRDKRLADSPDFSNRELLTERDLVRAFGDKVQQVRWSHRPDMVGLLVLGRTMGFIIVAGHEGVRKARLVDVVAGKRHVTKRYLTLKSKDSLSFLVRGLLRYVN